ncbi:hypothetical protein INR49_001524 [Caranx melampygus]|nr:hypothetical protein INR49_001524 [Caranx melampygus]
MVVHKSPEEDAEKSQARRWWSAIDRSHFSIVCTLASRHLCSGLRNFYSKHLVHHEQQQGRPGSWASVTMGEEGVVLLGLFGLQLTGFLCTPGRLTTEMEEQERRLREGNYVTERAKRTMLRCQGLYLFFYGKIGCKENKVKLTMDAKKKEMDLLSNSIAAYAHIKANPESFGLYFVLGVCFGLVLTLCLLVIRISCKPRTKVATSTPEKKQLKDISEEEESEEDEDEEVDDVEAPIPLPSTEIPVGNHSSQSDGTLSVNVFTSAEELERAQRLEERERIIREIWRNGQPDILGTGTGTIGRFYHPLLLWVVLVEQEALVTYVKVFLIGEEVKAGKHWV